MIDFDQVRRQLEQPRQGATKDGSLQYSIYDRDRGEALRRLSDSYPDGRVGSKRLPPRHPAQAPPWPSDLPRLRANEWNHILYGDKRGGGHLPGYGWRHGKPEFPHSWHTNDALEAVEIVLRRGEFMESVTSIRYHATVNGAKIRVIVGVSKDGTKKVVSAYPDSGM